MDRQDCIHPDCLILMQFGRVCEHSCPYEKEYLGLIDHEKPQAYSKDCLASGIPGATCQAPDCDC